MRRVIYTCTPHRQSASGGTNGADLLPHRLETLSTKVISGTNLATHILSPTQVLVDEAANCRAIANRVPCGRSESLRFGRLLRQENPLMLRSLPRTLGGIGLVLVIGCGYKPDLPDMAPVSGTVTFDGNPLPRGIVQFVPDISKGNSGPTASAEISSTDPMCSRHRESRAQ